MKRIHIALLLLFWVATTLAQTGKLTGSVLDSLTKTSMELATVSLFQNDSTLIGYKLSDKDGVFSFDKLPLNKPMKLTVSYAGYKEFFTTVTLEKPSGDTLNIFLSINVDDSNAVIVTAAAPIRMNGDTLEINPAAFKMRPDAVVEELLNEVPGITIWSDGTITVNGRKVQNFYVDGKPFLGVSDPRFATQNLPKNAIEKIQVYQEYDRANIGRQKQPQDSILNMNVKLKESSKKGYFGKMGAGYGTSDRFESDLSFQVYNKRSSLALGGGYNNTNKGIGNLMDMLMTNTYRNFNPNLYNVSYFGGQGINKNHSIGGLLTHNFIESQNSRERNSAVFTYNKSGTDNYTTDLLLQNRTTAANPQMIREEGVQFLNTDRHDLSLNYEKTTGYDNNLKLTGTAAFNKGAGNTNRTTTVMDAGGALQSTNTNRSFRNSRTDNSGMEFSFSKSDEYDPLKAINLQLNLQQGNARGQTETQSVFNSFTDNSTDTSFVRRYNTDHQTLNLGGSLTYPGLKRLLFGRFDLWGISLDLSQYFNFSRSAGNTRVSDFDSTSGDYIANGALSNFNRNEVLKYTPSIWASKGFNKWSDKFNRSISLNAHVYQDFNADRNTSSIAKRNLDRNFQFFRYEGTVNYQYYKMQRFLYYSSLNFSRDFSYASIDQLYTIVDDINAYQIRVGNPGLKNTVNDRLNLNANFNTQSPKSKYSINSFLNAMYLQSRNPVIDSVINDASGKRIYYYTNAGHSTQFYTNYNFNITRRIQKSSIQLSYNGSVNQSRNPSYVDGLYTISQNNSLNNRVTLQYTYRSLLVLNLSRNMQQNQTKQTAAGLTPFKNSNHTTRVSLTLNHPKNFTFSSTVDNIENSSLEKATVLWNAFASYRFLNQQGELKLSGMDLLKQYRNISNYANQFGTTTSVTNGLQQYFLVTFSYFPRKFGKREIKRRDG
ncbi:TonB-dependent receptor [Parasegetibacter sp. NRK P23]|uniref:TonB-dependent receptor n=1 Tax=Parasegetibacter sp. NRK P23 TaxID=2942999 RepID=UPI002042F270|nr:TonB-dependent receptor [Parasegetibacter sp. NRK P23]MCM5527896.1 TonB-dependent receptor [Parasegetibacter sp. NRK P23]